MFRAVASKMCRANRIAICQCPIPVIVPKLFIFLKKWEVLIWKWKEELLVCDPIAGSEGVRKVVKELEAWSNQRCQRAGWASTNVHNDRSLKLGHKSFWAFSSHLRTPKVHKVTQKVQQIQKPKLVNGCEFSLLTDSTEISSYLNDVYAGDRDQCGQRHQMATSCPQF